MVSRRRRFTREFKDETVKLITDSDNSVTEVAADLGIHPDTLCKRVRQYAEKPQKALPGTGHMTSDIEMIRKLKRENEG